MYETKKNNKKKVLSAHISAINELFKNLIIQINDEILSKQIRGYE